MRSFLVPVLASGLLLSCTGEESPPADDTQSAAERPALSPEQIADIESFLETVPEVDVPTLDVETALSLAAMPLACLDRPHAMPRPRPGYLDDRTSVRRPDYERTRAFYGCYDWHSAVNSTWAMVAILKTYPDLAVGKLIREKLNDHLSKESMEGELEYFKESRTFERPYGWAWLMKLYDELAAWDDAEAKEWAEQIAPLVKLFSDRMVSYLESASYPSRVGVHGNTAFSLAMMLDYARSVGDDSLAQAIEPKARDFYLDDVGCPTGYEPSGSDFLSPCLEEARLMSRVLDEADFVAWLDEFLAPVYSRAFHPLTVAVELGEDGDASEQTSRLAAKSHLIGLAFIRATALTEIADALPEADPRIAAYRKLAAFHGSLGFDAMYDADYLGTHWIGTFAVKYLLTARQSP
jgi:hypothetical protein